MEMNHVKKCAVTGASGYLGSRVVSALEEDNWVVYKLTSRAGHERDPLMVSYSLTKGAPDEFFKHENIDALVHCAYDFRPTKWPDIYRVNVQGSVDLIKSAKEQGVKKIIYISTMSAFEGCKSLYGKAKLAIEEAASKLGAIIIRPGLIYGDQAGGMTGSLNKMLKLSPVLPLVGGSAVLFLAHESDVTSLIKKFCNNEIVYPGKPVIAANDHGMAYKDILKILGRNMGKQPRFIPVPWQPVWLALKTAETLGLTPAFKSDSLISLLHQDPTPDFNSTRQTGVNFRKFST
jgi:nucleoside-diphosphate-sugar epimerase